MSLFFALTVITLIDAYKVRLISLILKWLPQDSKITFLTNEIKSMERELSTISLIHEFAKHVKLQRKINKLKEEKTELVKKKAFKIVKIRYTLVTAVYTLILGVLIALIWTCRSASVIKVPAHWLWPVSTLFDWSYHTPGSITVPCWIAISSSASKTFAKHF